MKKTLSHLPKEIAGTIMEIAEIMRTVADPEQWMEAFDGFFFSFRGCFESGRFKRAAFQFHQAAEALYSTVLPAMTQYKPKSHYLPDHLKMTNRFDPRLIAVFPTETEEEKYRFDLLVRGYVDARYKKNYSMSKEELEYLAERVGRLRELVEEDCRGRIVGGGLGMLANKGERGGGIC